MHQLTSGRTGPLAHGKFISKDQRMCVMDTVNQLFGVCILKNSLRGRAHTVVNYAASTVAHIISWTSPFFYFLPPGMKLSTHPSSCCGWDTEIFIGIAGSPLGKNEGACHLGQRQKLRASWHCRVPVPTSSGAVLTLGPPLTCISCFEQSWVGLSLMCTVKAPK